MVNSVVDCFFIYFFRFSKLLNLKRERKNLEVCREQAPLGSARIMSMTFSSLFPTSIVLTYFNCYKSNPMHS